LNVWESLAEYPSRQVIALLLTFIAIMNPTRHDVAGLNDPIAAP
jgi:hypothetical protein